jgi:integrase
MLVARYMGSRASVICGASIEPRRPAGRTAWVDLTHGVFYGRGVDERATKKRKQTVRIPPPLLAHLRRWRRSGQRFAVEWRGKPVTRVSKGHNAAVVAAGLGEFVRKGRGVRFVSDVTPHTWRHTVATWLMQAGADPWKAAGFLAMSVETLLRNYGHHHPDHSADVHAAIKKGSRAKQG